MLTINQTLSPDRSQLGHWYMWANDVVGRIDALRITPKKRIKVLFEPVEYTTENGKKWHCEHSSASLQYVGVGSDDSELISVCDSCDAQFIGGEWRDVL